MCVCDVWGIFCHTGSDPISAGMRLQTCLVSPAHSENIHLVKIHICEVEIKRNLTPGIKVSFCSAHPHTGDGGRVRNRREGGEE